MPFVVIKENSTPETDYCLGLQTTDNSVRQNRYNQTKPANFQSQTSNTPSQSNSSSPDTQTFPELSFQEVEELDIACAFFALKICFFLLFTFIIMRLDSF